VLLGWWQAGPPASQASLDEVCRVSRCHAAKEVRLVLSNGQTTRMEIPRSPIVEDGTVSIYVGERVVVSLEPAGGGAFRVTAPNEEPPKGKRLELELKQESPKPGQPKVTLLVSTSSLTQLVHFQAQMVVTPGEPPRPTSICPLHPSVASYEMWPHPVRKLLLRNFVVVGENTPCK
jgi:hypothetical protein